MDNKHYTVEKGTQCLLALLKMHGIRKIIVSPGATNMVFIGSVQNDPWFQVFSSVDERSAAYIACGMAAESGEPVVIACTGATASRNYMPGMTEAYYRKLPVVAVTYNAGIQKRHNLVPQQIDRSRIPLDTARMSVDIPIIKDADDEWLCNVNINKALLELTHNGGGPVHINIATRYSCDFSVEQLPQQRLISRIIPSDTFPVLDSASRRIAIFIGSHRDFTQAETDAVDRFCEAHNAVVFCDHTSGYYGKYRVLSALIGTQTGSHSMSLPDLLIHFGEISGDYYAAVAPKEVWRVSPDGEVKDTFLRLRYVFQMTEMEFLEHYASSGAAETREPQIELYAREYRELHASIPDLPFSNIWIAKESAGRIPPRSIVHLGILNTLRAWNFFEFAPSVRSYCNVGGFGIDGILSTAIGASLASPESICYAVLGDLAFFYDLNSTGNRHIRPNLRVMLINNGLGAEFTNYNHGCATFGCEARPFMAAEGHFGHQSHELVRHIARDLGFDYLSASSKEEYIGCMDRFFSASLSDKPLFLEVFTQPQCESDALRIIREINPLPVPSPKGVKGHVKETAKKILGEKGKNLINKLRK